MPRLLILASFCAALTGCDLCYLGYGREGLLDCLDPRAPDSGLAPPPLAGCWGQVAPDGALPTRAAARAKPEPVALRCGRGPLYEFSAACVESDDPGVQDQIDNDCDGMIDEGFAESSGHPAPPPVLKSSAYIFADPYAWAVDARGVRCDGAGPCETVVAGIAYHCGHGFHPTFDGRLVVLDRGPSECLDGIPGVCGTDAARAWLAAQVEVCSASAHTVRLHHDGYELHMTRLESQDIREPPRFAVEEFLADLHDALGCAVAATVAANTFGGSGDRDGDGVVDGCDACAGRDDLADRDGDGVADACDRCPDDADPEQRDRDGDGVPDACDVCATVADHDQRDGDGDGIGDACCGEADPDGDGVDNCDYLPPALRGMVDEQIGAPTEMGSHWDPAVPVPGEVYCDPTGFRVCLPAGTWRGEMTSASVSGWIAERIGAGHPDAVRVSDAARAVAVCNEQMMAALGPLVDWPAEAWAACMAANGGAQAPAGVEVPMPPARPIELDVPLGQGQGVALRFGVHGQRIVWWLGGYFRPERRCRYDYDYEVVVRGQIRRGRMDIYCPSTVEVDMLGNPEGQPGALIEVKWFRTDVDVWHVARVREFVAQAERHWQVWRDLSVADPWMRLVYMFGWTPPANATLMLGKAGYQFPPPWAPGTPLYEPIHEVAPLSGVVDRLAPSPMLRGRAYWTRFIPTDFEFIDGVLDEAPCVRCDQWPELCGEDDAAIELALDPRCRLEGRFVRCNLGDRAIQIRLTGQSDLYVNIDTLKHWSALYQRWCLDGLAVGCHERLMTLYDDIKCEGW